MYGGENNTTLALSGYYEGSQDVNLSVSGAAAAGQWHHVAVVHDSELGELLLYVDGELERSDNLVRPESAAVDLDGRLRRT